MSALGMAVKHAFDRNGLRAILGVLVSKSKGARAVGARRVFHRNGVWVIEYDDGYIICDDLELSVTPAVLYEQTRETWEAAYTLGEGDVAVDVGAGIGTEVFRWSRLVGPTGRVVAIEAHPATFERLRLFCSLNQLENVDLVNRAVSDGPGTVSFEEGADFSSARITDASGAVQVESVTLDDLLDELGVEEVDFVKMNIEGAETAALRGMTRTLGRSPHLSISCHDFRADHGDGEYFRTKEEVSRLLSESGFTIVPRPDDGRPWIRDQVNAYRRAPEAHADGSGR